MIHHRADREAGAVEQYLEESLGLQVQALEKDREHDRASGLPSIEVSTGQGKFL